MITNASLTVYHKSGLDLITHFEKWTRHNYGKVWVFDSVGGSVNKGYDNADDVQVRIPYDQNEGLDINDFAIGDILVEGTLDIDIDSQDDLKDYLVYNITKINNNYFGNNKHIHLVGR